MRLRLVNSGAVAVRWSACQLWPARSDGAAALATALAAARSDAMGASAPRPSASIRNILVSIATFWRVEPCELRAAPLDMSAVAKLALFTRGVDGCAALRAPSHAQHHQTGPIGRESAR